MNMIERRKAMAGQSGFTLIELLVVIAILAILAGAAIVGIGAMRENAKKTACKSDRDTIEVAAEAWALDGGTGDLTVAKLKASGLLKRVADGDFTIGTDADGSFKASAATGTAKYASVAPECNA